MGNYYTTELFKKKVYEKYGNDYTVLSECNKYSDKVLVQHKCGNKFFVDSIHFFSANPTKCPCIKDNERRERNLKHIKERLSMCTDWNNYELLEYKGYKKMSKFYSKLTNSEFFMSVGHFISGRRPAIEKRKETKYTRNFKDDVKNIVGDEYEVLDDYKGCLTPIRFRYNCNLCQNNIFYMRPNDFLGGKNKKGQRCPVCSGHDRKEYFYINKLNTEHKNSGFVIKDINFKENKVEIEHLSCGKKFTRSFSYINGSYIKKGSLLCPYCNVKSKANNITRDILESRGIKYIEEKRFSDLPNRRFDFLVFYNSSDFFIIENDGIQHEEQINYFDSKDSFIERQKRDEEKTKYAKEHNIPLFRIKIPKNFTNIAQEKFKEEISNILDHYKLS